MLRLLSRIGNMLWCEVSRTRLNVQVLHTGNGHLELVKAAVGIELLGREPQHIKIFRHAGQAVQPGMEIIAVMEERAASAVSQVSHYIRSCGCTGGLIKLFVPGHKRVLCPERVAGVAPRHHRTKSAC